MNDGQFDSSTGAKGRDAASEDEGAAATETRPAVKPGQAANADQAAKPDQAANAGQAAKADQAAKPGQAAPKPKSPPANTGKPLPKAPAPAVEAQGGPDAAAGVQAAPAPAAKVTKAKPVKAERPPQARTAGVQSDPPAPPDPAAGEGKTPPQPVAFPELPAAAAKPRHWIILFSFLLVVAVPILGTAWYLWTRAADQYASYVGFLVRSEQNNSALEALSGLTQLAQNSSSDTDILYKFIQSQSLVEEVARQVDLAAIWSKHPEDVIFSYDGSPQIEDLVRHWNRMVKIYYDKGMLDLRILAYDPADAKLIADVILAESQKRLDAINAVARQDSMKYTREDLDLAIDRLKQARQAISAFRNENQIIDPTSATMEQAGIVATLQQQLAEALVQLDMLRVNAPEGDSRITQGELRVNSIRDQITEQRRKVGSDQMEAAALAGIVSQFEALQVDRQFAEESYTAALAAFDSARASADRRALYLAAYVRPTLATMAEYPHRMRFLVIVSGFLLLVWLIGTMFYYGSRDRRR